MFIPPKFAENSPLMNHPGKLINLTGVSPTDSEKSIEEPKLETQFVTNDQENSNVENIPEEIPENLEQFEQHSETESIELVIQSDPIVNNNAGNDYNFLHESPAKSSELRVPESHRMNLNPYPGSGHHHHVPIDIVKSFSPVSPSHQVHSVQPATDLSNDIYNDYIQDPYNLTLQMESNTNTNKDSTVFQSASYFGNDSSDFLMNGP